MAHRRDSIQSPSNPDFQQSLARWDQSLVEVRGALTLIASDHDEYWVQFTIDDPINVAGIRGEKLKRRR